VCITEGIPALDMVRAWEFLQTRRSRLIGPNCPASSRPASARSHHARRTFTRKVGSASCPRSGTLTYEAVYQLTTRGIGQSTAIGNRWRSDHRHHFTDALELFNRIRQTREAVIMIGEIGGDAEESAGPVREEAHEKARGRLHRRPEPRLPDARMGHAGAIISGGKGTASEKIQAMEAAGIKVAKSPAVIANAWSVLGPASRSVVQR